MMNLENMNFSELANLDGHFLTESQIDELELNPLVTGLECLGFSGFHRGARWLDVQISDNGNCSNIDIYLH